MLDRSRPLNHRPVRPGPVLYWMNRDQRAADNWALLTAQQEAIRLNQPLLVVFCLQESFLGARPEHFSFMLEGLLETAHELQDLHISLLVRRGDPVQEVLAIAGQIQAGLVVTDFSPLRLPRQWRTDLAAAADRTGLAVWEIDAHNLIPCWLASDKLEFAARTLRPKIQRQLAAWLTGIPDLLRHPVELPLAQGQKLSGQDGRAALRQALSELERQMAPDGRRQLLPPPGPAAARRRLSQFIAEALIDFDRRNDPNLPVSSRLSPYLHFGQISAQRVALAVQAAVEMNPELAAPAASFLEELIVRRELSDNFCFYNPDYDNWKGFPAWARQTLDRHRADPRAYCYSDEQLEHGQTHDPLWNTAQLELRDTGQMPGYLRMYWAKKLLEWCATPEQAQQIAIALNDGLAIDGRDPNGYTGIAWSIGGVHDRPWGERPVFGTIRTMTYDGCRRKFSVDDYIRKGRYRRDG